MNTLLNSMKQAQNFTYTENGGLTRKSTMSGLLDLFAMGGSYRSRTDDDCIFLFKKAFEEDEVHALRCLFYLRDCRGGQGERRFFRVVTRWLASNKTSAMKRNLEWVPFFGRWDDLYEFVGTPLEKDAFSLMYHQLALDVSCKTPSLLAKWLKSENTSSGNSRCLGAKTRMAFKMTPKQYRKTLSTLRAKINVLERLMSENRWTEIEFDKIPSRAGLIYRNAFARHDIERIKSEKNVRTYEEFAKDKTTKVNAETLYPCDIVHKALGETSYWGGIPNLSDIERAMLNKYWDNLHDYFQNAVFNGVAVVDTSSSMWTTRGNVKIAPMDVACALGMYCAEKCNPKSPWHGHYISFSRQARLVPVEGVDFVDKCRRIRAHDLCENTNIESVFDLILGLALKNRVPDSEMPKNIIIISDMEFDSAQRGSGFWGESRGAWNETVMEKWARRYQEYGYTVPHLVFWNVDARQDNIPMKDNGNVTFVSGYSASLFEQLLTGKTGIDFVLDKIDSERYQCIK